MKNLTFTTHIKASPEKIWNCLLNEDSYKIWTAPFCPGTYYKTEALKVGNAIQFLNPEGDGMFGKIQTLIPNQEISFLHIGEIKDFQEQPITEETLRWTNALEKYIIKDNGNSCELVTSIDCVEEYLDYMNSTFPLALDELKRISEN